jgi:hypothetical protein
MTGNAIDWLDRNDKVYDVWMLVAYAATSCALVQVNVACGYDSEKAHLTIMDFDSTTRGHGAKTKRRR